MSSRNILDKFRRWRLTGLGKAIEEGRRHVGDKEMRFRIMNYNILAPVYLDQHRHLYMDTEDSLLDWGYRWSLLQREISCHKPDIVTLQEVQFSREEDIFNNDLVPWFTKSGYDHVAKQRTNGRDDGCVIFYRPDKFRKCYSEEVEYNKDVPGILDKDNIGLIVGLKSVLSGRPVLVATTHLLFSPRRREVRLAQTALMLANIDRLAWDDSSGQHSPVILTGDLNTTPASSVYELLVRGEVEVPRDHHHGHGRLLQPDLGVTDTCQFDQSLATRRAGHQQIVRCTGSLSHGLGLRSVHNHDQNVDMATTFQGQWVNVDYVLYSTLPGPSSSSSDGRREGSLKLLGRLALPAVQQMTLVGRIPNTHCPSDHLPLLADFLL